MRACEIAIVLACVSVVWLRLRGSDVPEVRPYDKHHYMHSWFVRKMDAHFCWIAEWRRTQFGEKSALSLGLK